MPVTPRQAGFLRRMLVKAGRAVDGAIVRHPTATRRIAAGGIVGGYAVGHIEGIKTQRKLNRFSTRYIQGMKFDGEAKNR